MALHSSVNEHPRRHFLGLTVAPRRKLDFHHSSPGCSALVCLLAESSCFDDDAQHPLVFLHSNCTWPQKQSWRFGSTFQRDGHGKRQIDSHLVCNVLFHLQHQMVYTPELLGDVRPFTLVSPHKIQLVKTDPPPIQHSRHNPQEELLHIVQQHQKILSKYVHESMEHGTSCNMSFWWRLQFSIQKPFAIVQRIVYCGLYGGFQQKAHLLHGLYAFFQIFIALPICQVDLIFYEATTGTQLPNIRRMSKSTIPTTGGKRIRYDSICKHRNTSHGRTQWDTQHKKTRTRWESLIGKHVNNRNCHYL